MKWRLLIEPEAEADLREAFRWYQDQRKGLGDEFLLAIEALLAEIQRRPESFQSVRGVTRRAGVRRFPCGIFYFMEDSVIHIIAVLHAARNPALWKKRNK